MSKTRTISRANLEALTERAMDLSADLRAAADVIRKNLGCDPDVVKPITYAVTIAGLSRSASDLTTALLIPLGFDEDRREIVAKIEGGK